MRIAAQKIKCSAIAAPGRGSKAAVAALRNVVALGFVALASFETLEAGAW